tara:strand:+ start:9419 stop:10450 length:1032 start_codon:yes stop_codon:yes gene_type:complete
MEFETGIINTFVGSGELGTEGDGGLHDKAQLNEPFMCAFDSDGNLFFCESRGNRVRKVDMKTGIVSGIAGTGGIGYSGDGGPAIEATFNELYGLQVDVNGDVYVVDRLNSVVRKIDQSTGVINTVAGTGEAGYSGDNGPGTEAMLNEPNDCFLDGKGGLLIADVQDQRIRRLDLTSGIITTFAGNGETGRDGDGGPATQASIFGARAVCTDSQGNTYICERNGNGIRIVDSKGVMHTYAGTGERGYEGDGGTAIDATWGAPKAIRCDVNDNLVVVDTENHAIRVIDKDTHLVTTVAGGKLGGDGDGGPATSAGLDRPHGCDIDSSGNIFIADSNNHRIRVVGA